ncbi:MAG: DUF4170 domain-containing protein [Alphaproteobacteria bacterium]
MTLQSPLKDIVHGDGAVRSLKPDPWPEAQGLSLMTTFWVVGGEYEDTSFSRIFGGGNEQRIGPYKTYDEAMAVWRSKAMETVDNANVRFHIEKEGGKAFWVVGASYKDTGFSETNDGKPETRLGPFIRYEDAKAVWRAKAMETVDDALARWRIEGA